MACRPLPMPSGPPPPAPSAAAPVRPGSPAEPAFDVAQVRLDNALALFEEFVRATARHADAATLRGLERRFAERVDIQPSYWSQIKSRARQIGERLARQFEQRCHKPYGWMDRSHDGTAEPETAARPAAPSARAAPGAPGGHTGPASDAGPAPADESTPRDDDERFIVGLVLTYYRRHPQRARTRLLDLLGEVLVPAAAPPAKPGQPTKRTAPAAADDPLTLWQRAQTGATPLKPKGR